MLPLNKILHFLMHKIYLNILFLQKKRQILKKGSEQIFKYIWISKNLRTHIQIYLVVQKSTNEYLNIFVLENGTNANTNNI